MGSFDNNGKLNLEELNNNLKSNIPGLTYEGKPIANDNKIEALPAIVLVDGYNIKIHENGNVTIEGKETPPEGNIAVPGEIVTGDENKTYTKNGTAIIPVGFGIVPGLDDVSEGLVISDVANDTENQGNQFVWIPVTKETPYERNRSYVDTNVSANAIDDTDYLPEEITNEEQAVRNAGGFYISRYEAGKEGTSTLVCKKGATVWINMYQVDTKAKAKTMYTSNTHVKSALISGIQWDMTMAFISSKPRVDGTNKTYNVTKSDSSRHVGSSVTIAGNNEADKVCNIYDLEGNAHEYIAEKNTESTQYSFVDRGGSCYYSYSASNRNRSNGDNKGSKISFRVVLYIV